ncbi:hypothetical protein AUJ84_01100 [Candidatus Pacearchaeota archaeon CG1_02_32_132]|nr:MAG: hypothetical protein AUJ84_01100 [Candidatus Pacearchaeota archaeon CG1_02_32_132]
MGYGYTKEINLGFEEAEARVRKELQKEGFGVLTEIDVKTTLKNKLDVDYKNYKILGACNPPFAYKALQAEKEIGLLLPCNVIIYKDKDKVFVSAINPAEAMGMVNNPELKEIAGEVGEKLKRVIDNL